jgi:BirA family transcriptional regulator, biotin operon repressor / biotin---[acetyl-CoA-carboxylase] ligase
VSGAQPSTGTPTSTSIGHPRVHLRRTGSTNERARELAFAGAPNGTLVTASEQTAGRGRQGRRWSAPAGSSVLMSLLLRSPPPLLPLIAAVAVCEVAGASSRQGEQARIKWPNDVVLDVAGTAAGLAKLAGILVEGRPQEGWAVLGIGLNVAVRIEDLPAELRPGSSARTASSSGLPAATLGLARTDVEPTLTRLIDALERHLAEPAETTLREWRARDALRGREIEWATGRGRADGIDGTGRLIVVLADGGRTALGAGEVHLRQIS